MFDKDGLFRRKMTKDLFWDFSRKKPSRVGPSADWSVEAWQFPYGLLLLDQEHDEGATDITVDLCWWPVAASQEFYEEVVRGGGEAPLYVVYRKKAVHLRPDVEDVYDDAIYDGDTAGLVEPPSVTKAWDRLLVELGTYLAFGELMELREQGEFNIGHVDRFRDLHHEMDPDMAAELMSGFSQGGYTDHEVDLINRIEDRVDKLLRRPARTRWQWPWEVKGWRGEVHEIQVT